MPELPEVQTVVNELSNTVKNRRILSAEVLRDSIVVNKRREFRGLIQNKKISDIQRRGKYIIFVFDDKTCMIAHLKMTGKFIVQSIDTMPHIHDRVVFELNKNQKLIFNDSRCFGRIQAVQDLKDHSGISKLGWEPWDKQLTHYRFKKRTSKRKIAVKPLLLDQTVIAGIGNIYASEILFDAALNPHTSIQSLSKKQFSRLLSSTRLILRQALKHNGTSISDYRRVDEKKGAFQRFLKVYGKDGQPCHVCDTDIIKTKQNQRSTFFCPKCQI